MFAIVRAEIEDRLLVVQAHIETLDGLTAPPSVVKGLKGLTFVQLYAVYEYAVVEATHAASQALYASQIPFRELRPELLALALDPECTSMRDCGRNRTWETRIDLLVRACSGDPVEGAALFPADGSHFRISQLKTIWKLFGVSSPTVPHNRLLSRVEELVEQRNGIAHGRLRAEDVGGGYSVDDLRVRQSDTADICRHLVTELETHVAASSNLRR